MPRMASRFMFTPADTAAMQRLRPMFAAAMSSAISDEEQAVSEVTLGPLKPKTYARRLEEMDMEPPVPLKGFIFSVSRFLKWPQS